MRNYLLLFLLLTLTVVGCSNNKSLASNLKNRKQYLHYVHDSNINNEKNRIAVTLDSVRIHNSAMTDSTKVQKTNGYVIPLLLINFWDYSYECDLGKDVVAENLEDFFTESFVNESKRSGDFLINPSDSLLSECEAEYNLRITVDSLSVKGPYSYKGNAIITPYAYAYSIYEIAGPAVAKCVINAQLQKNEQIVIDKRFKTSQISAFLKN
ncbi:MAG: hypothetical protein PHR06_12670 [Candidatus Cloacimonetes bacterium]|nr:hypothetical protein [Candidatus Cloacimonadota bacterium]